MKKLFEKNEVTFAIVLIVVYVVVSGNLQSISDTPEIAMLAVMVFHIIMGVVLFAFIKKNDLMEYLGLRAPEVPAVKMWFYIPLLLVAVMPVLFGIGPELSALTLVFRTVSMLFVGFLEEIIFRGFLFRGICRSNVTRAIIISSVTFGIGHIVNLLTGAAVLETLVQIVFAVAVGFTLVMLFHRTGSLLACIGFHSLNNMLTAFGSEANMVAVFGSVENATIVVSLIEIIILAVYLVYILKAIPKKGA